MGKNTIITRENIILKHRFYDLVIPKQPAISFSVHDCRSLSGLPVFLQVKAEKQKIVSRFFVGRLVYAWHQFLSSFLSPASRWNYLPNFIYFEKNIVSFLTELDENGYKVAEALAKMAELEEVAPPFLNSYHWQKELRKIIALAFISGEVVFIYLLAGSRRMTIPELAGVSVAFLLICLGVYALLSQMKRS
ncbi:MAG TPA: hypothetical protein P5267_00510 [Patescibacteria group bacterium]|nr:hypothetical protein [Patescibacteria group bacterium]